ncbi:MAG: hypothetical protein Q4B68_05795, partial [Bacteroidales bacterium]|nr:hypothetical protein [Bacteroidales bacterium]
AYDQVGQSAEAEVTITINTPTPEGEKFVLVTDASQLKDGGDIILVGQKTNDSDETTFYALGTTQNTNNRAAVVVTESNGKVAINDEVQVIKLEATTDRDGDAAWMFNVGEDAYLYAASSSSNHLKTNTASIAGNNGKASIEITSENIAMITFQGDNKRNLLKFNATNNPPIFSCYNTTQSPVYIYKRSLPVVEGVTMTGDYKAKFVDSNIRVANSYKNSVAIQNLDAATFAGKQITVTRRAAEGASTKPVPVATVTFSEDGTTYTVAYQNQTEVARYDSEDAPAAGNTANGVNIADYFIFEISSEGDVAGAYIYELASSDVEFDAAPFKAPVFNGTTVAYRMVNADKEGYTREEIVAEVITEQVIEDNSQLGIVKGAGIEFTFEPNAYAPEVTAPTSVTYKRNHAAKTVVEKSGYVYMEAEARQSATYAVEIEVNGNRYGTNAVTLRNAEVQVSPLANSEGQADNQVKSEYTFTATNGKKARYFFVAVTASMTGTGEGGSEATLTTEGGGFRLWRTSVTEPAEQYTGAGYEDFDARKGVYLVHEDMNLTENVGTFYDLGKTEMKFTDKAGTEHTYYKGTFGSSSETPAVTFLSRFYYKDATPVNQQSARRRAAAKAGENADIFYVAEEWYDFAFSNNIPTAVIDIPGVKEVKSVRYFNLMGVESADPVEGVNIVVTTYTDGTTSSAKVLR